MKKNTKPLFQLLKASNSIICQLLVQFKVAFYKQLFQFNSNHYKLKRIAIPIFLLQIALANNAQKPVSYVNTNYSRGTELIVFRLAIAVNGEFTQTVDGKTNEEKVNNLLNKLKEAVKGINDIYGKELCVRLELIPDALQKKIIFTNPATDPWPDMQGSGCEGAIKIFDLQEKVIKQLIGAENFDISHVLLGNYTGGCSAGTFHKGYSGRFDKVGITIRHEMMHQLGAGHSCELEPKELSKTIMCCDCEPYVHADSYHTVALKLQNLPKNVGKRIPTGNKIPTINAGNDKAIPINTPFTLYAFANDLDKEDKLTYVWDQLDLTATPVLLPRKNDVEGSLFTRFIPTNQPFRTFPNIDSLNANKLTNNFEQLPKRPRELNFRVTVNDNHQINYNGAIINASGINSDDIKLTVVNNGGAFSVTSQKNTEIYKGGESTLVTWDVNGTNLPPINTQNVSIRLSVDGGKTYPIQLVKSTPNNGSATIILPNLTSNSCRIKVQAIDNYFFSINTKPFSITQNAAKAGIKLMSRPSLLVSETGLIAKYSVYLLSMPQGVVKMRAFTNNQAELSLDGKIYTRNLLLEFNNTSTQTIWVRGKLDNELEGMHRDFISHIVYETADELNYPINTTTNPLNVNVIDAQIPPIVGVSFCNGDFNKKPANWAVLSNLTNQVIKNIPLDSGEPTKISLTTNATNCGMGGCAYDGWFDYEAKPRHSQTLDSLHGFSINTGKVTFTWSGLEPNTSYRLFVFGYNGIGNLDQQIKISGSGNPISFNQKADRLVFFVNDKKGAGDILINYAQKMVSTANGTITIEVTPGKTNNEMTLAGLGICK